MGSIYEGLKKKSVYDGLPEPNLPSIYPESRTAEITFSPARIKQIQRLQKQLGGQLPSTGELPPDLPPYTEFGQATMSLERRRIERKKRDAFAQLRKLGFSTDQIAGALAFEQGIKPPSKIPQTIGALGGTLLLGRLIPGPVDDIAIGARLLRGGAQAVSAGLGGMGGKFLQQWADPDAEFNKAELMKVGVEETVLEGITLGLAPIGRRLLGGAKKTAIAGAERLSKKLAAAGKRLGIKTPTRFLPAQFSENQMIDTIQGIGENSLVGSNVVFQYKKGQLRAAGDLVEGLSETISKGASKRSVDDVASILLDTIEDRGITHRVATSHLFGQLDVVIGKADIVDMRSTKTLAQEILERSAKAGNIGHTETSLGLLRDVADDIDDIVSFETAQDVRSGLLDILRKGQSKLTPDPKAVGIVKRLAPSIDGAMENAARKISPDANKLWRRANHFYKAGQKRFHNKTIQKLVRDLPDKPEAANVIFRSKFNILRVKKAAGDKAFQEVKGAWIEAIVKDSMLPDPTAVKGIGQPVGMRVLKKFNGIGQEALDTAFTKAEQLTVRDNARILATIQAKLGGQSGSLRFVQGAALAGIIASPLIEESAGRQAGRASGVLLIGPAVLGRLMTKPWFGKLLSEGYKVPRGTQKGIALTARLVRNVLKTRKEINQERKKRRSRELVETYLEKHPQYKKPTLMGGWRGFRERGFSGKG